jgi:hypothetical protein
VFNLKFKLSPTQIKAVLKRDNFTQELRIQHRKIHPDFKLPGEEDFKSKSDGDIALFILKNSVDFNEFVQPICLPNQYEKSIELKGFFVGYGRDENFNEYQHRAKYFKLEVQEELKCYRAQTNAMNVLSERSFCAKSVNSVICEGQCRLLKN